MSSVPITKFFPNIVTFLGLCIGLTSLRFSFAGKWEVAILLIIISAVIDGIDGRLARMLKSTSQFGAELDSFADLINFGVAPAFLLYFWKLYTIKVVGWPLTMAFVLCMTIRLARFNLTAGKEDDGFHEYFFTGVPAPIGAMLVLTPVIMTFSVDEEVMPVLKNSYFISTYVIVICVLTVSKLPTFSIKHVKIPHYFDSMLTFILALLVIFFVTKPWIVIPILSVLYMISIPVSIFVYSRLL